MRKLSFWPFFMNMNMVSAKTKAGQYAFATWFGQHCSVHSAVSSIPHLLVWVLSPIHRCNLWDWCHSSSRLTIIIEWKLVLISERFGIHLGISLCLFKKGRLDENITANLKPTFQNCWLIKIIFVPLLFHQWIKNGIKCFNGIKNFYHTFRWYHFPRWHRALRNK